jgi:hypothetical protein
MCNRVAVPKWHPQEGERHPKAPPPFHQKESGEGFRPEQGPPAAHSATDTSITTAIAPTEGRLCRSTTQPAANASSPCRRPHTMVKCQRGAATTATEAAQPATFADYPPPQPLQKKACTTMTPHLAQQSRPAIMAPSSPLRVTMATLEGESHHHGASQPSESHEARSPAEPRRAG